jgi:hypothetical protein
VPLPIISLDVVIARELMIRHGDFGPVPGGAVLRPEPPLVRQAERILREWLPGNTGRFTLRELAEIVLAGWPEGERPPSRMLVRRAVETLLADRVLVVAQRNRRTGYRYALAPAHEQVSDA